VVDLRKDADVVEVVTTRLDLAAADVGALHALLSGAEQRRASRIAAGRVRDRFIVARARLRQLLGARLGVRAESVELTRSPNGKPTLGARFLDTNLRFNLAHCDDVAAYAFGRDGEVGIDIEAVRVLSDADRLAGRFFSDAEWSAYRALAPADRPLGFFNCWTRKEAFIKAQGDGFGYPLDHFDVSLVPGEAARLLRVGDQTGDSCGWRMMSFTPAPGFVGAIAMERAAS
jgi:4'-phosphopantetheinyl transferase